MDSRFSDIHARADTLLTCYTDGEINESNVLGFLEGILRTGEDFEQEARSRSLWERLWTYFKGNEDLVEIQVHNVRDCSIGRLAQFYHRRPTALMEAFKRSEGNPELKALVQTVADKVIFRIRLERHYRGFVWSIASKERTVGYLVATMRNVDEDYADCEVILDALRQSHLVYGQRAQWRSNRILSMLWPGRGSSKHAMHDALMNTAYEMGKQFLFLEPKASVPSLEEEIKPEVLAPLAAAMTAGNFEEFEKLVLEEVPEVKLHTYRARNEAYLRSPPSQDHPLLNAFQFDRVVTTIFVDALHCVGEGSLLSLLEKEGYTLTRKSF